MNENEPKVEETDEQIKARLTALFDTPPDQLRCDACGKVGFDSLQSFRGHQHMLHGIRLSEREKKIAQRIHQDKFRYRTRGAVRIGTPEFKQKMHEVALKRWAAKKAKAAAPAAHVKRGTPEFSARMREAANKRWEARRLKGNISSRPYKNAKLVSGNHEHTTATEITQPQTIEVTGPNFCPECGHDLRLHKMSARLKKQLEG